VPKEEQPASAPLSKGRKPGDRCPGRDGIGSGLDTDQQNTDEYRERAVG